MVSPFCHNRFSVLSRVPRYSCLLFLLVLSPRTNSPLKAAPHTWEACFEDEWDKPYTRTQAAFPAPWVKANKFWPTVGRVDNVHGDRNLVSGVTTLYPNPKAFSWPYG